jgi:GDPmannose 4,6-dehydratase
MWLMMQKETADDYVIATGESNSLESFVEQAFNEVGLDWKDHVETDPALVRPSEIAANVGNPGKAITKLGWKPAYRMSDVVKAMVEAERS